MKLVMLRPSYKPDLSAGNHLAINLVERMIEEGIEIELIVPVSDDFNEDLVIDYGYKVNRVKSKFTGNSVLKRIAKYITNSINMFITLMKIKDVDIIFSHSMPPTLGPLSVLAGKLKKVPVIYWEQDIVSQSILSTEITNSKFKRNIYYNISKLIESISLKGSTHIITISEKFKEFHINDGINPDKISVIYNWIDTNEITPVDRNENYLFEKYNLDKEKFYVTYCGNLGVPQNVEIMVDAAKMLDKYDDIEFLIFGQGSREEYIKKYISKKNLNNIQLFPLEPLEKSKYVYSVGDIGLVIAKAGTSNNGFPSKTWTIMSAGQTMISCFDLDSELSNFVKKSDGGIAIGPDNSLELMNSIIKVYNMKDKGKYLGNNGREFVTENFSKDYSTNEIIKIINKIIKENQI